MSAELHDFLIYLFVTKPKFISVGVHMLMTFCDINYI